MAVEAFSERLDVFIDELVMDILYFNFLFVWNIHFKIAFIVNTNEH